MIYKVLVFILLWILLGFLDCALSRVLDNLTIDYTIDTFEVHLFECIVLSPIILLYLVVGAAVIFIPKIKIVQVLVKSIQSCEEKIVDKIDNIVPRR